MVRGWGWGLWNGGYGRGECGEFFRKTLDLAEQPAECICESVNDLLCCGLNASSDPVL